jgi:hypothetical protein
MHLKAGYDVSSASRDIEGKPVEHDTDAGLTMIAECVATYLDGGQQSTARWAAIDRKQCPFGPPVLLRLCPS